MQKKFYTYEEEEIIPTVFLTVASQGGREMPSVYEWHKKTLSIPPPGDPTNVVVW